MHDIPRNNRVGDREKVYETLKVHALDLGPKAHGMHIDFIDLATYFEYFQCTFFSA